MSSSSEAGRSAGNSDLELLDRVIFRLATADGDKALEKELSGLLCPSLSRLSSGHEGVRKKVLELLVHVNKRVKDNNDVLLPVDKLIEQYKDPASSSFVTNFTIIYLRMGFSRLAVEQQVELIPDLLQALDGKPTSHQDSLLHLMLPMLGSIVPPENDDKKKELLGLSTKPGFRKYFITFLTDYLLLPYGSHPSLMRPPEPPEEGAAAAAPSANLAPAGLCETAWKKVAGEKPIKAGDLERTKVSVTKFLGCGLLPASEVAMGLVVASADSRHSVVSAAETEMRRLTSAALDWEDAKLVSQVYDLFLGTLVPKAGGPAKVKPELRRAPANTRIRLKLMPYLLKSRAAALQFPACIQATFDLLFTTGGNTNAKLRTQAVSLMHHIIQHCPGEKLNALGPVLLSALTKLVKEEEQDAKLRGSCYLGIGKLGLKVPELVNKDITILQTFFEAISTEDKDTQLSVQEAMSMMAPSFKKMESTSLKFLEALLSTYVEKEEPQVRLVAVQYAGQVFPPTHVASRYILLLGAGDPKDDVANAARNHLYGALNKLQQMRDSRHRKSTISERSLTADAVLPNFLSMLEHVMGKASIRVKTQQRVLIGNNVLAYSPKVYTEILDFLRVCLVHSATVGQETDLNSEQVLTQAQYRAPQVSAYLLQLEDPLALNRLVAFAENLLEATAGPSQALCLLQLVGCSSDVTASRYFTRIPWLKGLLDFPREDVRESIAHLFGIIASKMTNEGDFEKSVVELKRSYKDKTLEYQHGLLSALGYAYGLRSLEKQGSWASPSYLQICEMITSHLDSSHSLLQGAACTALGEMGRCGPLPLPDGQPMDTDDDKAATEEDADVNTKVGLVNKLVAMVKRAKNSMRVRERAALAVGQIFLGDGDHLSRRHLLETFLALASEIKDLELHFTMGEALVYAALGPQSADARDVWKVKEEEYVPKKSDNESAFNHLEWTLDQLCSKYTQSGHPNVKQASVLWLLALLKNGREFPVVKKRLLRIQSAFMTLLGDNSEIVQDAASKGLGLVYDSSSEEQRDSMVKSLLGTLMEGRKDVQKVQDDSVIFEEGQMSKAPTGENLNTYKELCSLATDLNQPDLVYKFMHLANYNAMWNSKKGAAFGFSSIAKIAGEQLEPHLHKIVPKLYRYQFDPTPKIQASMSSIWDALVPESTKTVDRFFVQILEEIQTNMTSPQWRVRESCCIALVDLLRGRSLDTVLEMVPLLWTDLFRVMDDIKETVRGAAGKAASTLSRTCIRMCDTQGDSKSKAGEASVRAVVQPLLEKGLLSTVTEVRSLALNTIVKITRSAGPLLRPHLPQLIPALLEATSELESQSLGYTSVRLANDAAVQERLDLARMAAARASPMMECVNYVLQFVDKEQLEQIVPRLVDLIKGNTGLASKGTTAHLVTTLVHQCPLDLQAYAGKLLAAFVAGLTDRNAAVRKTYAGAIGHLMRVAKESSMEKLFAKLRTWYLEKDDSNSKYAVAYTIEAISRHNSDRLKAHAAAILPLVFLAMHESAGKQKNAASEAEAIDDEKVQEIWEEIWSDSTAGMEAGLRLYLHEIVTLTSMALDASQWRLKAQAARAMGTVGKRLGKSLPQSERTEILTLLLNSLAGRTWDGKEAILEAVRDVCCSSPSEVQQLLSDSSCPVTVEAVMTALNKECKKEKHEYKLIALTTTGHIVNDLKLYSYFEPLFSAMFPIIQLDLVENEDGKLVPANDPNADDDDDEEDMRESQSRSLELRATVYEFLALAWPSEVEQAMTVMERYLPDMLKSLFARVQSTTKKNQVSITQCLGKLLSKWQNTCSVSSPSQDLIEHVLGFTARILALTLAVPKSSGLRQEGLSVLGTALDSLKDETMTKPETVSMFSQEIGVSLDNLVKDLSIDAATKALARDLRAQLMAIMPPVQQQEMEVDQ